MATIYADPSYQPRHPVRSAALIVLLALVTFLVGLVVAARLAAS